MGIFQATTLHSPLAVSNLLSHKDLCGRISPPPILESILNTCYPQQRGGGGLRRRPTSEKTVRTPPSIPHIQKDIVTYLYLKAFHIFFVICWFAGLFYLPRLYVNLTLAKHDAEYQRLLLMALKLYRFITPLGALALITGLGLWLIFDIGGAWLKAKLFLVLLLMGYHGSCGKLRKKFSTNTNRKSHHWFRVFNELPVLLLLAILILVVVKPF